MVARGPRALVLSTLAAILAGCDQSVSAGPTPGSATQPAPTLAATGTPPPASTASPRPTFPPSSAGPSPAPTLGPIQLNFLARQHVPGSKLRSASGQLVWSGGPQTSTRIWRYVPGATAPELVVDVQRRNSTISDVVAGAAGYAFVEVNAAEFGLGGWRIWFTRGPGARLVELDRGVSYGAGFPPTLAMDARRIAWAAFDEPRSGDVSRLRIVRTDDLDDLPAVTTLIELPVRDGLLWLPALNGDELWYAILHPDWDGSAGGDEFHVEMLDLAAPGTVPVRFDGVANDFSPAVSDSHVAWKTAVGDGAALNWGTLTVQDRATSERWTIPVDNVDSPSIGTRFVAFEELTRSRLAVFDLETGRVEDLLPADLAGTVHVGGQSISGSLLAFFTQPPGGDPRIGWAVLPD